MNREDLKDRWALILGASSGFGAATARAMARAGMHIFGVHLDTRATLDRARQVVADIEAAGRRAVFFNTNAADARKRARVLDKIEEVLADEEHRAIHFVLHSLAFGSLLPFIADEPEEAITEAQMDMTLRVMAHSLVYWVQDLVRRGLLVRGSRVYTLSSGGAERVVVPYGAVSAAKAALESHVRQLALELGPRGIAVNCLRPGVTDTPALRAIPGHEQWVQEALQRNPGGRLTTPEDVATTLVVLADPAITWISGAMIPVDGGELIVG
ncbi:MAG TPA: SDR family oxidoreductase [Anaerolineales bacterium]|nr:SDR family oxidoreductase [Anaerolineae bacterium]HIQ00685.1 SDR family oxidoreductase [Anaerolineales bacterium]